MKKKLMIVLLLLVIFMTKAECETFKIGNYIPSAYVKMEKGTTKKYLTVQYILSSTNEISYCIEPFILLDETSTYQEETTNISSKIGTTKEILRKIELISYYGYGYKERTDPIWYAITQVLIWKTIDPEANIYFTSTSNGTKTDKYDKQTNEILNDVNNHDNDFIPKDSYQVNHGLSLTIKNIPKDYIIEENPYYFTTYSDGTLETLLIVDPGQIKMRKISNNYDTNFKVFTSSNSQKVIKRGNVINEQKIINVKVMIGSYKINFNVDEREIYPITPFEEVYMVICKNTTSKGRYPITSSTEKVAKSIAVGECKIYNRDENDLVEPVNEVFEVFDGKRTELTVNIRKIATKISIKEYLCTSVGCTNTTNTVSLYDKEKLVLKEIDTSIEDFIYLYPGTYFLKSNDIEGYEPVPEIEITVTKEDILKEIPIYNTKIEPLPSIEEEIEEIEEEPEEIYEEESINEIEPPYTKTKDLLLLGFISLFTLCIYKIQKNI